MEKKVIEIKDKIVMTTEGLRLLKRTETILWENGTYTYPVSFYELDPLDPHEAEVLGLKDTTPPTKMYL